ncbi:MAG: lysophospholipase, partial [Thiolinea sp.]
QLTIFHQSWLPEGEANAVIVLVHGLGEHSGRYQNVINSLVPRGYAIHALDHLGHGRSDGVRKHVNRFDDFIETLHTFSGMVRAQYAGQPIFLLGHSMGGLIASRYLLEHQAEFNGAILSAPALKVDDSVTPLLIWIGRILSVLLPRYGVIPMGSAMLSRDPAVVQAYLDDPLVYSGKTTARLAAEIVTTMNYVRGRMQTINLPVLILQGSADRIVHPEGAQAFHAGIDSDDKTLKVYEGWYHELFNEPEREAVLTDVLHWLRKRC